MPRPTGINLIATYANVDVYENWGGTDFHYTVWRNRGQGINNWELCLHIYEDGNSAQGTYLDTVLDMAKAISNYVE